MSDTQKDLGTQKDIGTGQANGPTALDLEDQVLAIVDRTDTGGAAAALRAQGFKVEALKEESDIERLEPNKGGIRGALSKAAAIFGDEYRIIDQIERALVEGNHVLVVEDPTQAAVRVLRQHGALAIWDFGSWTFVKVGSTEKGEEEVG